MIDMAADGASMRAASNGAGAPQLAAAPKAATRTSETISERMALNFSNIVAVLMRDWGFRNLRLADLEWLVLPPVLTGQWRLAHSRMKAPAAQPDSKECGAASLGRDLVMPVATVLWASVSSEVDKRLCEKLDKKLVLRPDEWASGDILWLIAAAGDPRAIRKIVKELRETEFKGRRVKLRTNGPNGQAVIKTLSARTGADSSDQG